jgi:hypothetical protein
MIRPSPFRYFKTGYGIIRLAAIHFLRFSLLLRRHEDFLHEGGIKINRWPAQPRSGLSDINGLQNEDGWTAVAFPPPLAPATLFSLCHHSRVFSLFPRIMVEGLSPSARG